MKAKSKVMLATQVQLQRRLLLLRQRPLREECSDPEYRSPILFGRRHVLYVLLLRLLSFL